MIDIEDRRELWKKMCSEIAVCKACDLGNTRTKAVVYRGNPQADWCFVVEMPREDDDLRGKSLVGVPGKLFDKYLADCQMPSNDWVAINCVNCRAPKNKFPSRDIASICIQKYLWLKLDLIRPKILVVMGKNAAACFAPVQKIGDVAGRLIESNPKWGASYLKMVCATYHPAYALQQPHIVGVIRSHMRFFMAYAKKERIV